MSLKLNDNFIKKSMDQSDQLFLILRLTDLLEGRKRKDNTGQRIKISSESCLETYISIEKLIKNPSQNIIAQATFNLNVKFIIFCELFFFKIMKIIDRK